jgi:hypothetical protein
MNQQEHQEACGGGSVQYTYNVQPLPVAQLPVALTTVYFPLHFKMGHKSAVPAKAKEGDRSTLTPAQKKGAFYLCVEAFIAYIAFVNNVLMEMV